MRHEITYGGGDQFVYHVPRDRSARAYFVASATYQIVDLSRSEDDADRVVQASGGATVDSTSTTTDAAAGPGQSDNRQIPVTSEAGFAVGHVYQITQDGRSETFLADYVASGVVRSSYPLRNDYTTGATVRGLELRGTFPTAEASDEDDMESGGGPYAVIWEYTIDGREHTVLEDAWVVRYSVVPMITETDVLRAWPLANELMRSRATVVDAIAVATEDFLARLEASGRKPELFRHSVVGKVAVRDKALAFLKRWQNADDDATRYEESYNRIMNDLTTGQYPERTVEVSQSTNTADKGGEKGYGTPRFRIS